MFFLFPSESKDWKIKSHSSPLDQTHVQNARMLWTSMRDNLKKTVYSNTKDKRQNCHAKHLITKQCASCQKIEKSDALTHCKRTVKRKTWELNNIPPFFSKTLQSKSFTTKQFLDIPFKSSQVPINFPPNQKAAYLVFAEPLKLQLGHKFLICTHFFGTLFLYLGQELQLQPSRNVEIITVCPHWTKGVSSESSCHWMLHPIKCTYMYII